MENKGQIISSKSDKISFFKIASAIFSALLALLPLSLMNYSSKPSNYQFQLSQIDPIEGAETIVFGLVFGLGLNIWVAIAIISIFFFSFWWVIYKFVLKVVRFFRANL